MTSLILNALAFKEGYSTSSQLKMSKQNQVMDLYLKNSLVSLASAKKSNPSVECILFVNTDIPDSYQHLFTRYGIKILTIEFNNYVLPANFKWALAFFKLQALEYAVRNFSYDQIMLIDSDTFTLGSYDDIWEETQKGILLFDVDHRVSHPDRDEIIRNYQRLVEEKKNIIHYGGEFIAAKRENLLIFVEECNKTFDMMKEKISVLDQTLGDEFIISIVGDTLCDRIIRANKYIYRYWTSPSFYLVATNYFYNNVDIWHLPSEKKRGMLKLYRYLLKNNTFPRLERCAKILALPPNVPPITRMVGLKARIVRALQFVKGIKKC